MYKDYRKILFYTGMVMIIIGLPFSKPLISMGEMLLFGNWLIDKNILQKITNFFKNRIAVLFSSMFFLLVIGLLWTQDFKYAYEDIRTKIPILIFPLVLSDNKYLNYKVIKNLLFLFVFSVFVSISISFYLFISSEMSDVRFAFPYVSHIRMSIMIYLSICILLYYLIIEKGNKIWYSLLKIAGIVLFLVFLMVLELMTGMLILLISGFIFLISIVLLSSKKWMKIGFSFLLIILVTTSLVLIFSIVKEFQTAPKYDINKLPTYTQNGNLYAHIPKNFPIENGSYIGLYICENELRSEWGKRSHLHYDSTDIAGQPLSYTIIRFLNSKHLTKDSVGLSKLSQSEIQSIENGIANVVYLNNFSVKKRLYKILWEWGLYENEGLYAGQSVIQRFELWKTGMEIYSENLLIGVGTGDIPNAFRSKLKEDDNLLKNSNLRSHNQFISTAVTFGTFGLIVFLMVLFLPVLSRNPKQNWLYFSFIIAIILSMIWEDTIETQVGVTIYAFFNSLYWFSSKQLNQKN